MSFCLCQCVREWVTSWPCWELRKTTMRTWWECTPTAPWSWKTWKSPTPWSTRTCPSSRSVSSAGFGLGFSLSVKHTFLFQLIISQITRQFLDWLLSFPSFNLFIWDLLNTQVFFICQRDILLLWCCRCERGAFSKLSLCCIQGRSDISELTVICQDAWPWGALGLFFLSRKIKLRGQTWTGSCGFFWKLCRSESPSTHQQKSSKSLGSQLHVQATVLKCWQWWIIPLSQMNWNSRNFLHH